MTLFLRLKSSWNACNLRKRFALCYRSIVSLFVLSVCLSVTLVYCGQTVGRIKMKLGMQVGLRPGHIVLGRDPPPSPPKGAESPPPSFRPYLSQPNGWMGQDATWYGGRPQPRRLYVRWGPRLYPPRKLGQSPLQFSAHFYCGQTAAIPLHASRCHLVWR